MRNPRRRDDDYKVPRQRLHPAQGAKRGRADQLSSKIEPFYSSGGMSYWVFDAADNFFPMTDGVQLLAQVYVPAGRVGFIKELRVAPYCPAVLTDPWFTSGVQSGVASWRAWNREDVGNETPIPDMGRLWDTPMGWEAAYDNGTTTRPTWTWWLRYFQGNITTLRSQMLNIPPFSTADPSSWYLVPNIPVPSSAYAGGIPGNPVGPDWSAQRMQVLPTDKNSVHIPIPQDTTILLFARWSQSDVAPYAFQSMEFGQQYGNRVNPIGPSIGSLVGYTQTINSQAAADNIQHGWGG